ncbi:amino acid permease [Aspergillus luchuensis]|uniref:Amino acid permease n=1 Tax=Aspergillus kawachii TaxID=1069201 RepID=A0A146FJZ0_ASPKA|nr:amino acid permease [Aspergillus luchuensis]
MPKDAMLCMRQMFNKPKWDQGRRRLIPNATGDPCQPLRCAAPN